MRWGVNPLKIKQLPPNIILINAIYFYVHICSLKEGEAKNVPALDPDPKLKTRGISASQGPLTWVRCGWLCGPVAVLWPWGEAGAFGEDNTWESAVVVDHICSTFRAICPAARLHDWLRTKAECKNEDWHIGPRWWDKLSLTNRGVRRCCCWHQLPLQKREGEAIP